MRGLDLSLIMFGGNQAQPFTCTVPSLRWSIVLLLSSWDRDAAQRVRESCKDQMKTWSRQLRTSDWAKHSLTAVYRINKKGSPSTQECPRDTSGDVPVWTNQTSTDGPHSFWGFAFGLLRKYTIFISAKSSNITAVSCCTLRICSTTARTSPDLSFLLRQSMRKGSKPS